MAIVSRLAAFARNLMQRNRVDADLSTELEGYVELLVAEKVRAGIDPREARRQALAELGGTERVKENVRAVRTGAWVDGITQDVRYAVRSLRRVPSFTATAIIALALGIGASTAIFSVVNGVLLRPLPYRDPNSLVTILHNGRNPVAVANYIDWRRESAAFTDMAAADYWTPNLAGIGDAERILALKITPNMLPMLGVSPALGRVFGPETADAGRDREVVLDYRLWQRRFGGDSAIVGKIILLDGASYAIVGVMPQAFGFAPFWARGAQLWVPLAFGDRVVQRGNNSLRIFARIKPNVSIDDARADIARTTARVEAQFPGTNANVVVTPLMERVTGSMRKPLGVLLIAVGFLLVAACANVAHMLMARAATRQREMAVRIAIGASRLKLMRQLLTESLLLSVAGGALGLVIAQKGMRTLLALGGSAIPRSDEVTLDGRVLLVTLLMSLATGILFGLAPAFSAMRTDLIPSLKDGGRAQTSSRSQGRFRYVLVGSQFAVALSLLIGAGLMMRTLSAMQGIQPGFDPKGVFSAVVSVGGTPEAAPANRVAFYSNVIARVRALPGVTASSAINHLPIAGDIWGLPIWLEGQPLPRPGEGHGAIYRVVFPGYFATMGISLESGRDVNESDRRGSEPVAVVNQRFAEHFWPNENPIGKRFTLNNPRSTSPEWITVIGVAKNSLRSEWIETPDDEMYLPFLQNKQYLESSGSNVAYMTVVGRTTGDPMVPASAVRGLVSEMSKGAPVSEVQTISQVINAATTSQRFFMTLFAAFAGFALTLAAVGIYGVMSHAVSRRTHEIGLRIALGAAPRNVRQLIVGQGMIVAVVGAAVGITGALALTRLMDTIIYGVRPTDPITFIVVTTFLLLVAGAASWLPARRATRIDPLAALRSD